MMIIKTDRFYSVAGQEFINANVLKIKSPVQKWYYVDDSSKIKIFNSEVEAWDALAVDGNVKNAIRAEISRLSDEKILIKRLCAKCGRDIDILREDAKGDRRFVSKDNFETERMFIRYGLPQLIKNASVSQMRSVLMVAASCRLKELQSSLADVRRDIRILTELKERKKK